METIYLRKGVAAMYFWYKKNKYCINCDWLQYSVMLDRPEPVFTCPDGYRLELCQGNNIYKNRGLLYDHTGRKILTLLWSPYSSVLSDYVMTVQVANEELYTGGITRSLDIMHSLTRCMFNSLGRVDFCCDFEGSKQRINTIKHLHSGHYYVQGKEEGADFWHNRKARNFNHKENHCLNWGSKKSEIKVKLYHKSRELGILDGGEADKPWIVNEWKQCTMKVDNVWRLEFSMKTNGQMEFDHQPIHLDDISSARFLLRIFCDLYNKRFITRINQGRIEGHKNKDERVHLLELPSYEEGLNWRETQQHTTESPAAITLLRSMMRTLNNQALIADKQIFAEYVTNIQSVIHTFDLYNYFQDKFGEPSHKFLAELQDQSGPGIMEKLADIDKLIN